MTNVAVIYYSSTGNVHALATAVAEGAAQAGADVRLRRVAELAPAEAIDSNPDWRAHADATANIPEATHDGADSPAGCSTPRASSAALSAWRFSVESRPRTRPEPAAATPPP